MEQIGFKNFRKFKELQPLSISPVTIFVGENNAGKSTVVKALLSVLEFIRTKVSSLEDDSWLNLNFYFNKNIYTHVGTYTRARYNKAGEGDPITFFILVDERIYEIDVEQSDSEADVYGRVSRFKIILLPYNIEITYSLRSDHRMSVIFHARPFVTSDGRLCDYEDNYFKGIKKDKDIEVESTLIYGNKFSSKYVADALLDSFKNRIVATCKNLTSKSGENFEDGFWGLSDDEKEFFIRNKRSFLNDDFLKETLGEQKQVNVEYIYAHAVTQTILFSAKDTNDYHVKTVHEYANLQGGEGSPAHDFILKWMQAFKIGQNYKITSVGGEAHLVKIQNLDGEWVNLADKGMGSIQLMILLFRVATKMAEAEIGYGTKTVNYLLIIEEPEQNLHPMLQSKLADFFYELYRYGFYFIIETHSEYLIRRSQVIVKEGNMYNSSLSFDDEKSLFGPYFYNPFKVIYFPENGQPPYDMLYRTDGKFSNEFGTGFFDEASNLAFKLF